MKPHARVATLAIVLCLLGSVAVTSSLAAPAATPSPTSASEAATGSITPTSTPATITVAAVGDMCFAPPVSRLISRDGSHAPFSATQKVLAGADVTVGNLECALSKRGSGVPGKTYTFEGPPSAATGLAWAGFDLLAQGNNHARDFGAGALKDTISNLDKAKIAHAGAGASSSSAFRAAYITRNGVKIAYLSYSQIGPASFRATKYGAGTAYTKSLKAVTKGIKAAKKKADYVIVSFHWGVERQTTPTSAQVTFGRAAVRAGANLVLSHHPHVIEGVEFYRKGLIAYSLGNFVFSPGSASGHDTLILTLKLGPHGVTSVVARPMHIDGGGRPRPATGSAKTRILKAIRSTSRGRHTKVALTKGLAKLRK